MSSKEIEALLAEDCTWMGHVQTNCRGTWTDVLYIVLSKFVRISCAVKHVLRAAHTAAECWYNFNVYSDGTVECLCNMGCV